MCNLPLRARSFRSTDKHDLFLKDRQTQSFFEYQHWLKQLKNFQPSEYTNEAANFSFHVDLTSEVSKKKRKQEKRERKKNTFGSKKTQK